MRSTDNQQFTMERYFHGGVSFIILGVLSWITLTVQDLQKSNVMIREQVNYIQTDDKEFENKLRAAVDENYTKADAKRDMDRFGANLSIKENDFYLYKKASVNRYLTIEKRISILENKIEKIKAGE